MEERPSLEYINPGPRLCKLESKLEPNLSNENKITGFVVSQVEQTKDYFLTQQTKQQAKAKLYFVALYLANGESHYFVNRDPNLILIAISEKIKEISSLVETSSLELLAIAKEIGFITATT